MRKIGMLGFILIVLGLCFQLWEYVVFLNHLRSSHGNYYLAQYYSVGNIFWKTILILESSALVFFYLQVIKGKVPLLKRAAGLGAVMVATTWIYSTGYFYYLSQDPVTGGNYAPFFTGNFGDGIRYMLGAFLFVLVLVSTFRAGYIVFSGKYLTIILILWLLELLRMGMQLNIILQTEHYYNDFMQWFFVVFPLSRDVGFLLFWGSLLVAKRQQWTGSSESTG